MRNEKITLDDPRDFLVWREGMGRTLEIYDIQVSSERRKGRGSLLLKFLYQQMPSGVAVVYAFTRWGNKVAHQFYERNGYTIRCRVHEFYRDLVDDGKERRLEVEDAVMWARNL